jgi:hypothetical protein
MLKVRRGIMAANENDKRIPLFQWIMLISIALFSIQPCLSDDPNNGDWSQENVTLHNTAEADLMVRIGDIDNLNFGWPDNFDPFSGESTPIHPFPWAINASDPAGTDRIMVVSSFDYSEPIPPLWGRWIYHPDHQAR